MITAPQPATVLRWYAPLLCVVLALGGCGFPPQAEDEADAKNPPVPVVDASSLDFSELARIPVQDSNRYRPLSTFARVMVRSITGKEKFNETDPLALVFWWRTHPEETKVGRFLKLPSADVCEEFGLDVSNPGRQYTSLARAARADKMMRAIPGIREKLRIEENLLPKEMELWEFYKRVSALSQVVGLDARSPDLPNTGVRYLPIVPPAADPVAGKVWAYAHPEQVRLAGWDEAAGDALLGALAQVDRSFLANDGAGLEEGARGLHRALVAMKPERDASWRGLSWIDREIRLERLNPFSALRFIYFSVFFVALLGIPFRSTVLRILGFALLVLALGYHSWALVERTLISQRAMIGNFYESAIFVSAAASLVGVAFWLWKRSPWWATSAAFVSMMVLFWAQSSPGWWNPEISELQAVLINNSLIHVHVPVIMTSYAVLALAVVLAHAFLIIWWGNERHPELKRLSSFLIWTIAAGVVLLFAGIILGGVWADASWGRFWGNDPKEIAAGVTWAVFVIIIHGRWAGWLRDMGTSLATLFGGISLVWTYWGANFIQKGLHSYAGAGTDAPTWPYWYFGLEVAFFGVTGLISLARRGEAEAAAVGPVQAAPWRGPQPEEA